MKSGGPTQRHRSEIHPARETLPLRGDSEISLQPEFYNRCCGELLPREFSRALIYRAYNVLRD